MSPPQPTMGFGVSVVSIFLGYRTLLVDTKMQFFAQSMRKINIFV